MWLLVALHRNGGDAGVLVVLLIDERDCMQRGMCCGGAHCFKECVM